MDVDWNYFKTLNPDNLDEDENEKLFSLLSEVTANDVNDVENLKLIFHLAQSLLQTKSLQTEVALEEQEKLFETENIARARREQELVHQIEFLESQIIKIQNGGNRGLESGRISSLMEGTEFTTLRRENERLLLEVEELKEKFSHEKTEYEKQQSLLENAEKEKWELRHELSNLKEELHYYRQQLESHLATAQSQNSSLISVEVLKEKNIQLQKLLQQNQLLETENDDLNYTFKAMKLKLEESSQQMELMASEYSKMKFTLQNSNDFVDKLQQENQILEEKLSRLEKEQIQKSNNGEDVINSFASRLQHLKDIIRQKNLELTELQQFIQQNKHKTAMISDDSALVSELLDIIKQKDKRIDLLKDDIANITADYEANVTSMSELPKMDRRCKSCTEQAAKNAVEKQDLQKMEMKFLVLQNQLQDAENRALIKDKEFTTIYSRLKEYEEGEYGLSDAVAEIKELHSQLKMRDRYIEELIECINKNHLQLQNLRGEQYEKFVGTGFSFEFPTVAKNDGLKLESFIKVKTEDLPLSKNEKKNSRLELPNQNRNNDQELRVTANEAHDIEEFISQSTNYLNRKSQTTQRRSRNQSEASETINLLQKTQGIEGIENQGKNALKLSNMQQQKTTASNSSDDPNTAEVVRAQQELAQLKSYLLKVLKQLDKKNIITIQLHRKLEECNFNYKIILHQVQLLYAAYLKEKQEQ